MGKKNIEILEDENIVLIMGFGFISYLNGNGYSHMIRDLRENVLEEKKMFLPVVYSFIDSKDELEEYEVLIQFGNGKVIREDMETYQFPDEVHETDSNDNDFESDINDEIQTDKDSLFDFDDFLDTGISGEIDERANKFIYEQLKANADIFKDYDYEEAIIKLEKEGTERAYNLICMYYTLIDRNNDKMRFHYKKKLAMMGNVRAMDDYQFYLDSGTGCTANRTLADKEYYRSRNLLHTTFKY